MKFKQKIMGSVLALGLVTSSMFVSNANTEETKAQSNTTQIRVALGKWVQENGDWYYYQNGAKQIGWIEVNGVWYYLKSNGVMSTGWEQIGGKWYYLRTSGAMTTGWEQVGNVWYYFEMNGQMATGWKQLGNKWYYLNSNGIMQVGWQQIENKWYYFYGSGVMATNATIDGWKINANGVGTPLNNNSNNDAGSNSGSNISDNTTVYVTPSGKSYHLSRNCTTLKRSKKVSSMTLKQAKGQGKKDPCNMCVK